MRLKEFQIVIETTISMSITVAADSVEQAVEAAKDAAVMSLCHQCARGEDGEWRTSGELDCDPANSRVVSVYVDGDEDTAALEQVHDAWGKL